MNATSARYWRVMIALHWMTAMVVLLAYFLSEGGPGVRSDPPRWHFISGMAVLLLVVPRLISRALGGAPPLAETAGQWLTLGAKLGVGTLYLLLYAVPLTG